MFLYVHQNSDDFQMFFPSACLRQRFYDLVLQMTADMESMVHELGNDVSLGTAPQVTGGMGWGQLVGGVRVLWCSLGQDVDGRRS